MIVVRTAQPSDLDTIYSLSTKTGPGMTTFKPDRDAIAARLARVQRTLADAAPLAEQGYLFVMEDTSSGQAIGVCGLETAVGLDQPFYTYRKGIMVHASRELKVWSKMPTLYLSHDLTGYSELCSLFLDPDYRSNGNGPLLSKSRFLFLAEFPGRFPERICAEMRGVFDAQGKSPFWEALGRHFFAMEFDRADYLVSLGKKAFLAELMPKHPVYVDFLPEAAQAVIGLTHPDTVPARKLLEAEGMRFEHHIDVFEAGPVLESHIDDLRASRESGVLRVTIAEDDDEPPLHTPHPARWLVANRALDNYRVILAPRAPDNDLFRLTAEEARTLQVAEGDSVRAMSLNPKARDSGTPVTK
jgi:arginine N-succinyltransferase